MPLASARPGACPSSAPATISTASPASKSPSTSTTPTGSRLALPSRTARTAPAPITSVPREGSASLLPLGVVDVLGDFDAGHAVEIVAGAEDGHAPGRALAKGICSYSAAELRRVIGLKSEAVREILPRATDEAVHRDYLVVD